MDKAALNTALDKFKGYCEEQGYPLADLCLEEAYPGVDDTSYILHIKADWVEGLCCSDALDVVVPFFFDSVDQKFRRMIFAIKVTDSDEVFHCFDAMSEEVPGRSRTMT